MDIDGMPNEIRSRKYGDNKSNPNALFGIDDMLILGGASLLGGIFSGLSASSAARSQSRSAQAGIEEQRRQFDAMQKLLAPYVQAGTGALGAQQNLIGLGGTQAQQAAISALENSPEMLALTQQGENAMLANASATGGLRGGNLQGALAQYRPQVLSNLINQQYSRLGGLSQLGQASAAGVGAAGMGSANSISDLLAQQGAAQAGGALGWGNALSGGLNNFAQLMMLSKMTGGYKPGPNTGAISSGLGTDWFTPGYVGGQIVKPRM